MLLIVPHQFQSCPPQGTIALILPPPPRSSPGAEHGIKSCSLKVAMSTRCLRRTHQIICKGGCFCPLLIYLAACEAMSHDLLQGGLWWRGCCSSPARAQRAASSSWEPWRSFTGPCCPSQSCLCRCLPRPHTAKAHNACGTACHGAHSSVWLEVQAAAPCPPGRPQR